MEGKWLTNPKMSIDSVTKLTMQCSLEKGKCSKMYLPFKLFSKKLERHKSHSNRALVRPYMEDGICTGKNLYGKHNFTLKTR